MTSLDYAYLTGFMIQGIAEEVVTRGFLQNALATEKNFWFAMILQALFFSAFHGLNPGITFMVLLNLFLVGIMFGMAFWYTDSIWFVSGLHFIWNFMLGPIIGIEVSGTTFDSTVFITQEFGSELITGGAFGLEASIFTSILAIAISIYFYRKIKNI